MRRGNLEVLKINMTTELRKLRIFHQVSSEMFPLGEPKSKHMQREAR